MEFIKERRNKGFEVQLYGDDGNASHVVAVESIEALAQYLARCCWGQNLGKNLPTVWHYGTKWCAGKYTTVEKPSYIKIKKSRAGSMTVKTRFFRYNSEAEADEALDFLYEAGIRAEKQYSEYFEEEYCFNQDGHAKIVSPDGRMLTLTRERPGKGLSRTSRLDDEAVGAVKLYATVETDRPVEDDDRIRIAFRGCWVRTQPDEEARFLSFNDIEGCSTGKDGTELYMKLKNPSYETGAGTLTLGELADLTEVVKFDLVIKSEDCEQIKPVALKNLVFQIAEDIFIAVPKEACKGVFKEVTSC